MKDKISENRSFLMGLAMIAVVIFHHDWISIPIFSTITHLFGLWGVDVFLFASVFGCAYALNKYTKTTFWLKRILRLLPTCVIVGILIYCFDIFLDAERTITYLPVRLLSLHRWYIQAILICYLICPFAYIILKRYQVSGLFLMILLAIVVEMFLPRIPVWKINWVFGRIPVFLIGMYIAEFNLKLKPWQYTISALCLVLAVLTRYRGGYYMLNWTNFLALAMPFVCETLCRLRNISIRMGIYRPIEIIGMYSLEIYLIHEYLLWAIYPIAIPLWSKYLLFISILVVLSILVKWLGNLISAKPIRIV